MSQAVPAGFPAVAAALPPHRAPACTQALMAGGGVAGGASQQTASSGSSFAPPGLQLHPGWQVQYNASASTQPWSKVAVLR